MSSAQSFGVRPSSPVGVQQASVPSVLTAHLSAPLVSALVNVPDGVVETNGQALIEAIDFHIQHGRLPWSRAGADPFSGLAAGPRET
jgi:hypothetical protein